ncbi:heavy metal-binding protein HIP-like [Dreissena polymorpha]|uniref:C1q domain-containing protein n=1 Tax=Dreissena polymorpha TaxID=45954 RepID=A0A9D4KXF5_DREPO|nr:heavy metal-binding protein HIP-like [Dreissena polymorpha]KAH3847428.1 hypothetical protein DPMN_089749 [Dreissena polymorpha]
MQTVIFVCVFGLCVQAILCDVTSDIISALKQQEGEIEFLKARIAQLEDNADQEKKQTENKLKAQETVINMLMADMKQATESYRNTTAGLNHNRRFVAEEPVAFSAVKTAEQANLGPDQTITFETVLFNGGGGYHPNTGYFIAPQSGVYMFSTSVLHRSQTLPFYGELTHNGKPVARIHADGGIWDSGSQTVIIEVQAGDDIWVRNIINSNELIHGNLFCSFSGVLLMQL